MPARMVSAASTAVRAEHKAVVFSAGMNGGLLVPGIDADRLIYCLLDEREVQAESFDGLTS